jgi:hypothetical protein
MFKTKIKRLGGRLALITAVTALMAAAGASAASATVTPTPSTGIAFTGAEISVTGNEIPSGTTDVALVVCNMTATPGTKCDVDSGTPGFVTRASYEAGVSIPVRRGPWTNYDFTKGTPPSESGGNTTCYSAEKAAGSPCAVLAAFYELTFPGGVEVIKYLGAQAGSITFK